MNEASFAHDASVLADGRVLIPEHVRAVLGIDAGDRVTFLVDGNDVRLVGSTVHALRRLQDRMRGEAEKAGFRTEDDVAEWITQSRREENAK